MSTYVVGDLHGCMDAFLKMLEQIHFSGDDRLYTVGDVVDRGPKILHLLHWLEDCPENVFPIRGNHDEEFCVYVELMRTIDERHGLRTDPDSHDACVTLYQAAKYALGMRAAYFDLYGTIGTLLRTTAIRFSDLMLWASMFRKYPLTREVRVNGRRCVIVHGGYREDLPPESEEARNFYLYAREEAWTSGGLRHGMIVGGHTPTISQGFAWTGGKVARHYDKQKDCVFYDVDCGCVFRPRMPAARLACLRLEDEAVFYV